MTTQVFVIGTGRSGTTTLARWLSTPAGCHVGHEQEPLLLAEVTDYLSGRLSHADLVALLRATRSTAALGGECLSGEANQRLSFVLPALAEAFPAARLVWIVRDGRTAIASMWHRRWYQPREAEERPAAVQPWIQHRLRADQVGEMSTAEWEALDGFARCCWYWAYTNRHIERDLARLQLPALCVRIEDLDLRREELVAFLGSAAFLPRQLPRANEATGGTPLPWRAWSPSERATFRRLCGPVMDRHYPDWEASFTWTASEEIGAALARSWYGLKLEAASRTRTWRARFGLTRGRSDRPSGGTVRPA